MDWISRRRAPLYFVEHGADRAFEVVDDRDGDRDAAARADTFDWAST